MKKTGVVLQLLLSVKKSGYNKENTMCLDYASTLDPRDSKGYKVTDNNCRPLICIRSKIKYIPGTEVKSSRKTTRLTLQEHRKGIIEKGIHIFSTKYDAIQYAIRSRGERIFLVSGKKEDFVASGSISGRMPCLVYTKVTVLEEIKY